VNVKCFGLLFSVTLAAVGCGTRTGSGSANDPSKIGKPADPWPRVVADLARSPDAMTARRALFALNDDFTTQGVPLPVFSPEGLAAARALVMPGPDELRDWTDFRYTAMDAQHAGESLFFDAVADSLGIHQTPVPVQAHAAFDWTCRQVYNRPWMMQRDFQQLLLPPVPPQFVLKRGYGVGWDRESVFLALARQLGLDAYLIGEPGQETKPRITTGKLDTRGPFWAVGVRDGDDVILFDPWLCAPIPTADGTGVLKLSEARANPNQVSGWHAAQKTKQPVPAEAIAKSVCYAAAPANAFPPRMKLLQEKLAAESGVVLSVSPTDVAARGAKLPGGPPRWWGPPIDVDAYAIPHVLGTFLPQGDGGYDTKPAGIDQVHFLLTQIEPLSSNLFAFANNENDRKNNPLPELTHEAAQRAFQDRCYGGYKQAVVDSDVRDRIQRGQFNEAIRQLQEQDRTFALQRERQRDPAAAKQISDWCAAANAAYAKLTLSALPEYAAQRPDAEAAVDALWRQNPAAGLAVGAAVTPVITSEVSYRIALAKHEQAARSQIRYRRASAENAAVTAWAVARDEWSRYQEQAGRFERSYPGRAAHAAGLAARATQYAANPDRD
jgi:hypothetical protein